MGWQTPPLWSRIPAFATPGNVFVISYSCFIFVVKEKSPKSSVDLNIGICDLLEYHKFCSQLPEGLLSSSTLEWGPFGDGGA